MHVSWRLIKWVANVGWKLGWDNIMWCLHENQTLHGLSGKIGVYYVVGEISELHLLGGKGKCLFQLLFAVNTEPMAISVQHLWHILRRFFLGNYPRREQIWKRAILRWCDSFGDVFMRNKKKIDNNLCCDIKIILRTGVKNFTM